MVIYIKVVSCHNMTFRELIRSGITDIFPKLSVRNFFGLCFSRVSILPMFNIFLLIYYILLTNFNISIIV